MKKSLARQVASLHGFWLKLGPRIGGPFVKIVAYYAMYRIVTNGGLEALAFVCYEHMLNQAAKEKQNGTQTGVRKDERP